MNTHNMHCAEYLSKIQNFGDFLIIVGPSFLIIMFQAPYWDMCKLIVQSTNGRETCN